MYNEDDEPNFKSTTDSWDKELELSKADLLTLTDEEFETQYKATKRLYSALISALKILKETHEALQEPGPTEIDPEVVDSTLFLIQDYAELLEQLHMASYWEREGM
jgi:hypothetical protein